MKHKTLFRRLAKSKKGFDDLADIVIGLIFIALIFIVVFVYITSTEIRIEKAIKEEQNNLEKDYILLNYLRTPMEGKDISIAEYLGSLSRKELEEGMAFNGICYEGKASGVIKEGLVTKETKEILQGISNWQVKMLISGGKEFCSISKDIKKQKEGHASGETARAVIPSNDPGFNIEIYFTKG